MIIIHATTINAVITNSGDIHLFEKQNHWKINVNKIVRTADVLIHGFIKVYNQNIPTDILKMIEIFSGFIIIDGEIV